MHATERQTDRDTERVVYQGNWAEEKVFEKRKVFKENVKELMEVQ